MARTKASVAAEAAERKPQSRADLIKGAIKKADVVKKAAVANKAPVEQVVAEIVEAVAAAGKKKNAKAAAKQAPVVEEDVEEQTVVDVPAAKPKKNVKAAPVYDEEIDDTTVVAPVAAASTAKKTKTAAKPSPPVDAEEIDDAVVVPDPVEVTKALKKGNKSQPTAAAIAVAVAIPGGVRKKFRFRQGTKALREVRKQQMDTNYCIRRAPFKRLMREVMQDISAEDYKVRALAFDALQEAAEVELIKVFQEAVENMAFDGRVETLQRDVWRAIESMNANQRGGTLVYPTSHHIYPVRAQRKKSKKRAKKAPAADAGAVAKPRRAPAKPATAEVAATATTKTKKAPAKPKVAAAQAVEAMAEDEDDEDADADDEEESDADAGDAFD